MGASDEIEYLKHLISQLNEKVQALEARKAAATPKTPIQQLRTILIGPPGAGEDRCAHLREQSTRF